ncbi:hypothetical protein E4U21_002176 [Claviceps maximensis]|nr:hypothetical protein E4U21_002176 [Claviceps maximensis]
MEDELPQSNLDSISLAYRGISHQSSLNDQQTPNQLVALIQFINERFDRLEQTVDRLEQTVDRLEQTVDRLNQEVNTGFKNAIVRQNNSYLRFDSSILHVMYDVHTGREIEDFPMNLGELDTMERETPEEGENAKRKQLMAAIGVVLRSTEPRRGVEIEEDSHSVDEETETLEEAENARRNQLIRAIGVTSRAREARRTREVS